MEEVEEGEAWSGQEDGTIVDPDIALSYIDEKIQDILGHFQKDFEGGVSAEKLGSKFGGYGSFLPTYARSPEGVPNQNNNPISTHDPSAEGAHHRAAHPVRAHVTTKNNYVAVAPQVDDAKRNETCAGSPYFVDSIPPYDMVNKLSKTNAQKIPKVRIKVDPNSALPRCNAAIYSDMGLVCSPSSSLEGSPTASGPSPDTRDSDGQSPISVLKIMTGFPIPGGYVLSPLSDHLSHLIENEKPYLRDCTLGTFGIDIDAHDATKTDTLPASNAKNLLGRKAKTTEKSTRSSELENQNGNADTEKCTDIQMSTAKMLVFDDRNTPIRSNSRDAGDDKTERQLFEVEMKASGVTKEPNKNLGKDREHSCDLSAEEPWEGMPSLESGMFDAVENNYFHLKGERKSESHLNVKVLKKGKLSNNKGILLDLHNKGRGEDEQTYDVFNPVTGMSKGRKDAIPAEDIKLKDPRKSTLHEGEGERMLQVGHHSSGTKRKTQGCNDVRREDNLKENRTVAFPLSSKEKKRSFYSSRDHSESKQNTIRYLESSKILSVEFNSLGKAKAETSEYGSCLTRNISRDEVKDSTSGNEKNTSVVENANDKLSDAEKPPMSEALRKCLYMSPSNTNGSAADAAPAPSSESPDQESWVLCDRCQKWRLLPYWIHPDQLPHKWICKKLNWLPGMNKCCFSEDETASALKALYQASVPENQSTTDGPSSEIAPETDSTSVQDVDHNHLPSLGMRSSGEKKRNTMKDVSCQVMQLSHSAKKNKHVSIKSRSLCQYQVESNASSEPSFQPVNKSTGLSVGKVDERQKDKRVEQCSSEGDFGQRNQLTKSKSKRGSEIDGLRTSKRLKMEETCNGDEDWHSGRDKTKSVPFFDVGSLSKVSPVTVRSVLGYNDDSSCKDSKCNSKDLSGSRSKPRTLIKISLTGRKGHICTSYKENYERKDALSNKKRVKEQQEQVPLTMVGSGVIMNDRADVKEEISGGKSRKEKNPRISKADERVPFETLMDDKMKKNSQPLKVLLSTRKACSLYGMEKEKKGLEDGQRGNRRDSVESEMNMGSLELKKDLSYVQTCITATSSSSKVSGIPINRSNFQEARGSPVESVSSSPSRIPNANKFGSEKDTLGRDDPLDADLSLFRRSRRCPDGEVVGQTDQCATVRGGKSSSVAFVQNLGAYPGRELEVMDPAKGAPHYLHREAPSLTIGKAKDNSHFKTSRNFRDDSSAHVFEDFNLGYEIQDNNCWQGSDKQKSCYSSSFGQQKSCKGSSLRTAEKHRSCVSDVGKQKKHRSFKFDVGRNKVSDVHSQVKASDSLSEKEDTFLTKNGDSFRNDVDMDSLNLCIHHEDLGNGRFKDVGSYKEKKVSLGKCSSEYRRNDKLNFGVKDNLNSSNFLAQQHSDPDSKVNEVRTISTKKIMSLHDTPQKTMTREDKSSSNCLTQKLELTERGRSQPLAQPGDKLPKPQYPLSNANAGSSVPSVDVMIGDASRVQKHPKVDSQYGANQSSSVHTITNKDDVPSPIQRDGNHPVASVVLKEATDLKHTANRLKKVGLEHESTDLYFQAALKFLHVAYLLESSSAESGKHAESTQSMLMYSQTAKLCGFCAHEYEKRKEMAAATALAYKCMEVAYMKVVYSRHSCASKDRHELQTALHMVPSSSRPCCPGESPSSSASDIENFNQSMVDKAGPIKNINSPQMAGSHVIVAHHRPTFGRLLNFVQDVSYAMEASRKYHTAFRAANDAPEESHCGPEGIASVRKVLNFSFHDVEGLLLAVRRSIDSISR